ncbi:MAG: aminoglycoside phosphotransferase family protein [Armatimonadetes bacterium]|nr:aminoglycoside phosphotransferase family protein [Armatimonadota bacterium]
MSTDLETLVTSVLADGYGLAVSDVRPGPAGLDTTAVNLEVQTFDGGRCFLKQSPSVAAGAALTFELARQGVPGVVAPLATRAGGPLYRRGGSTFLLFPFLNGKNGFEKPLATGHWKTLGTLFRCVHSCQVPPDVAASLPTETWRVPGVDRFWDAFENGRSGPAQTVLDAHRADVVRLIERTEAVGRMCRQRGWELVPCHGDAHVGNVLVDDSGSVWTVDWDGARLAPRECDLVFFLDGGIMGHDPECGAAFLEGYGEVVPDVQALTYFRYCRALEDVVSFTEDACRSRSGSPEQESAIGFLQGQFRPGSVYDLAVRDDRW